MSAGVEGPDECHGDGQEGEDRAGRYLGRPAREKDVDLLLRALSVGGGGLDRCQLIVAGSGDQWRRMERLTRRLDISQRVRFLGSVDEEEVRTILVATDVLAMPSMTDTQSLVLGQIGVVAPRRVKTESYKYT